MLNVPVLITLLFIFTTLATVGGLVFIFKRDRDRVLPGVYILIGLWMVVQAVLGYTGFYRQFDAVPPRFLAAIVPPFFVILLLLGRYQTLIRSFPLRPLTFIHTVRIPVEIVLYYLYLNGHIPKLMTYEGRNFDILAGITAPIVAQLVFRRNHVHKNLLLIWNILALGLLINIVGHAILSTPTPVQQLAFEQPNIAVFYFPFIWLPSVIVPIVLFSHLVSITQLIRRS